MDARDAEFGRESLVSLAVLGHPVCEQGHAQNVRSSYNHSQAPCTMIGWRECTMIAQDAGMDQSAAGDILRQWREDRQMSLEALAQAVELLANSRGIPKASKKVPRTHASMSRWETGVVDVKELGLSLIAEVYNVPTDFLRRPPPERGTPPKRRVEVREDQADAVEAFVEALERRGAK